MKELSDSEIRNQFAIPNVCDCWRRPWHIRNKRCDVAPWVIQTKLTRVHMICQLCFNGIAEVPHLAKRQWGGTIDSFDIHPMCNNCHKRFDKPWFKRMLQDDRGNIRYSKIMGFLTPVLRGLIP